MSSEKYKKYLYFGILNGAAAAAMLVITVMFTVGGDPLPVQLFGYAAVLMWSLAAFLLTRVYFAAKKADEERLDDNNKTI